VTSVLKAIYRMAFVVAALFCVTALMSGASAHSGHDHGPSIEVSASVAPRFEAASDDFEVLGVLRGPDLVVTLDSFRTNEPIARANIEATIRGEPATITAAEDGTYRIASPELIKAGRAEVVLTIQVGTITDLLAGAVEVPGVIATVAGSQAWWQRLPVKHESLIPAFGGLMIGALCVLLFRARQPTEVPTVPVVDSGPTESTRDERAVGKPALRAVAKAVALVALASGGVDARTGVPSAWAEPPAKASITITADLPQRLPDGSLFVPKITQRLLAIRTIPAGESTAGSTIELNGQIIADPNGFGRVQATVDGRIDAPKGGLVVVGQKVERGQPLAILTPIVASADRSSFESASGEIDTRIALGEAKLARLTRVAGVVAQKDIDDTRTELETLKTRRTAVRSAVRETVTLTAPISGTVSMSTAVPGQLANAREALFEIVDPARMWVEAIAFDARLVADITAARAVETTGEILALDYIGRGVSARQQGLPLHFSIKAPPATLVIGKPVNVLVTTKETRQGMILPQAAVVKGQNGLFIVWTHTQAERFKPNVVKVKPIDGQRLLVDGGLAANERVVIEGATLLNQVR
jgi:membrane fusion protein, heavy metal efflux system